MVDLADKYRITSNRESGLGRYDIMLEPLEENKRAYVIEFKVLRTVLQLVKPILLNVRKQLTLMQFMTLFMKWQETKLDTEKHSLVCLRDTSENKKIA